MPYQDQIEEIVTTLHAQSGKMVYKAVQVEIRKCSPDTLVVDVGFDTRVFIQPHISFGITPEGELIATLCNQGGETKYSLRLNEKGDWSVNDLETTQEEVE